MKPITPQDKEDRVENLYDCINAINSTVAKETNGLPKYIAAIRINATPSTRREIKRIYLQAGWSEVIIPDGTISDCTIVRLIR